MTAASQGYSCLPNRADTQLQTLSVTPRETKCKRDGVEEMKNSKKKEWQSKTVAETKKDETERLVSTARFSAGVFHDKWDYA